MAVGSRFGGLPWIPDGEPHPRCKNCKKPLRLLLQLQLSTLPEAARERLGSGLLQAFYCQREDCEQECSGWSSFSGMHLVRRVDASSGSLADPVGKPFPPREITGWRPMEDQPSPSEHKELGLHFDYDFEADTVRIRCPQVGLDAPPVGITDVEAEEVSLAAMGDKLLGWPHWVQGVEYPECPTCGARMESVFQLDSESNLPLRWGDSGVAHITRCPAHPEVLTLGWACA